MTPQAKARRLCLLAASLTATATLLHPQSTSSPLAAAQQAFARKDWTDAAARSAAVVNSTASSPVERLAALRLQSRAEVNLSAFAAAEHTLGALLAVRPGDAAALYLLGFTLQREGRPRQSLEAFTRAAALQTPTADDLKLVGLDYVLLSDYPDALHWLERSTTMDPHNAEGWYDLGRAQMHEGQFHPAETSFRHTLALEPAHVKALDNLGLTLEAQNRTDEALESYAAAIRAQDVRAQDGQAQGIQAQGIQAQDVRGQGVERQYQKDSTTAGRTATPAAAGRPAPTRLSEQPLLNYGTLSNTRSGFAEAAVALTRATGLAPGNPRCWEELARAEVGLGQNAEARAAMEQAVHLDPKNPRLHYQLGRIYRSLQMKSEADAAFARSSALYGTKSSEPESLKNPAPSAGAPSSTPFD